MFTRRQFLRHTLTTYPIAAFGSAVLAADAAADEATGRHRLLILDIKRGSPGPGADHHQLLLVDVESGKVVAQQEIGIHTSLAVSPKGDVVAAVYNRWKEEGALARPHLDFFQASDLKRLDTGLLPLSIPRLAYQLGAGSDSWLSPDGQQLIIQGKEPDGPTNAHMGTTVLNCVKRGVKENGFFKPSEKPVRIPRAHVVDVVSVADWPRVHVWNRNLNLLYVADFSNGKILSTRLVSDDPALEKIDPAALERVDEGQLLRLKHHGWMLATGGRYAYYVPMSWAPPGCVRKIDLSADPPKVVRTWKERQPDLETGTVAVSQKADRIFVLMREPLRIKVLNADDLTAKQEFKLSLVDSNELTTSRDGKYLYALDSDAAKVAVIDRATGREVKLLEGLGKYPYLMTALAEGKPEK